MSTEILAIENGKDVPCITTAHSSGFVESEVLSLKRNVHMECNVGAGDGHNVELVKSEVAVNINKDVEDFASFKDESIASERFVSVIEKLRVKRKIEEDGYTWKQPLMANTETVSNKIDSLIGKLRRRFSEEKQTRADTIKPSYSQYIFSNSVDAFLRYHEKPKVEIHYSEADGSLREGVYSFAVRPSRIRKRRKETQENANVRQVPVSAVTSAGLENSGGFENSTGLMSTVPVRQNTDASGDVLQQKSALVCHTPSAYKASDLTVSLISNYTNSENVNSHEISPSDSMQKSETADVCVVPPANKMVVTADVLSFIAAIATPSKPYFPAKAYGHAITSMSDCLSSNRNNDYVTPVFQNVSIRHGVPPMFEYHSSDESISHATSPFQPFQKVIFGAEINGSVYKIDTDMLLNMAHSKRGKCGNSNHTLYKAGNDDICELPIPKQLSLIGIKEIYGHALLPISYMLVAPEPMGCTATPVHKMTLAVEIFGEPIHQIYEFDGHTYKEKYDKTVSPVIKRAALEEIHDNEVTPTSKTTVLKEIYDHMAPPVFRSTSGKVHDYENVSVDVSTFGNTSSSAVTTDNMCHTADEVDETTYKQPGIIIDAYDDDSPFGILSVYCNSEIHSGCGKMLKTER